MYNFVQCITYSLYTVLACLIELTQTYSVVSKYENLYVKQVTLKLNKICLPTHEPEDVSWYPALQTHTEESAPVILQVAPLPQLQSRGVVVNGIFADVKALLKI